MPEKNGSLSLVVKVAVVLVLVGAGLALASVGFRTLARVETVTRGKAVAAVSGSVVVYADGNIKELKSEARGTVVWCEALDPGKGFKEGEVLVRLDTTELERQIEQSKRDFETAQRRVEIRFANNPEWKTAKAKLAAALSQTSSGPAAAAEIGRLQTELDAVSALADPRRIAAKEALAEAERLQQNFGTVSVEQVKQARRVLEAIETEIRLAQFDARNQQVAHEVDLANKRLELEKMTIKAPFAGAVKDAFVWKGALIGSGATVATIYSNARIVVAKIGEEDFGRVSLGQSARVRLLAYPNQEFDAKVIKILPTADESTQRYTIYLDVKIEEQKLIPYSTGEVTITVDAHDNVPLIPRRAVFNGSFVYVVKDGRVEKREIGLGLRALNIVEVTKNLTPGEQVIVENLEQYRDGQSVRPTAVE